MQTFCFVVACCTYKIEMKRKLIFVSFPFIYFYFLMKYLVVLLLVTKNITNFFFLFMFKFIYLIFFCNFFFYLIIKEAVCKNTYFIAYIFAIIKIGKCRVFHFHFLNMIRERKITVSSYFISFLNHIITIIY